MRWRASRGLNGFLSGRHTRAVGLLQREPLTKLRLVGLRGGPADPSSGQCSADARRPQPVLDGLHRRIAGSPLLWTRYADRVTTPRPTLDGVTLTYESGSDNVLTHNADADYKRGKEFLTNGGSRPV